MQQPLAVAIISGLIVQLPLVLLVMPSLFLLLTQGETEEGPSQEANKVDPLRRAGNGAINELFEGDGNSRFSGRLSTSPGPLWKRV